MHSFMFGMTARIRTQRRLCLALAACCWLVSVVAAARQNLDSSIRAFYPDSDPVLNGMTETLALLPAARLLFVNLSSSEPDARALTRTADAILKELSAEPVRRAETAAISDPQAVMALVPYYADTQTMARLRVMSEAAMVEQALHDLRIRLHTMPLGGPVHALSTSDPLNFLQAVRARLSSGHKGPMPDPLSGYSISSDGRHLLLTLYPEHSIHDAKAASRLMEALDRALKKHLPRGMQAITAGGIRHSAANEQVIRQDIACTALLSLFGMALIYLFLVRSRGAVWLFLTPCFAACVALGCMGLVPGPLSAAALGFGAAVLGVAEDYAVHSHFVLRADPRALYASDRLAIPLFQGWAVNVSGFVILLFSGIPAMRQLACFALLTLTAGFLLSVTVLPVCPGFAQPPLRMKEHKGLRLRPTAGRIVPCFLILTGLCAVLFPLTATDVSPGSLGADMQTIRKDTALLQSIWKIQDGHVLTIEAPDLETALSRAETVTALLRRLQPDNAVRTVTDILPSSTVRHENLMNWSAFVREHAAGLRQCVEASSGKYGFRSDAFLPFFDFLQREHVPDLTPDLLRRAGLGELVDVFIHRMDTVWKILVLTERPIDAHILEHISHRSMQALAPGDMESSLLLQFRKEKRLLPAACLLCLALFFLFFRDLHKSLLALLPPLCSILFIEIWLAVSGRSLTLTGLAAMPLVLGLAADHGIMTVHGLSTGIRPGLSRAVWVSSLTTLTGMGVLALARHPALQNMGEVIVCGLLAEVPVVLWLLPRLCAEERGGE